MTPPVLLALGPQIDEPGSLPNTLLTKLARSAIARQLASVLHTARVPVRVLTEDGRAGWPQDGDAQLARAHRARRADPPSLRRCSCAVYPRAGSRRDRRDGAA